MLCDLCDMRQSADDGQITSQVLSLPGTNWVPSSASGRNVKNSSTHKKSAAKPYEFGNISVIHNTYGLPKRRKDAVLDVDITNSDVGDDILDCPSALPLPSTPIRHAPQNSFRTPDQVRQQLFTSQVTSTDLPLVSTCPGM